MKRIFLSPPWVGKEEREAISDAFQSGYVAPCGPQVDEFERLIAKAANRKYAVALSSGTAAIDLAMAELSVDKNWIIIAPTLTFIATVGPAFHRGAKLIFVDCDKSANIDVKLLEKALKDIRGKSKKQKVAVIAVDLYGRVCDYKVINKLCKEYNASFILDSAEAVGASDGFGRAAGSAGTMAIYSFNGNKIITTSGGGALLTDDKDIAFRAKKRSQQSRENFPWYEHVEVGYNYRMSNLLASVGLAQLKKLPQILKKRKENYLEYKKVCNVLPEAKGENHWLTVALFKTKNERDLLLKKFEEENIEARPVWKPMHMQSIFKGSKVYGGNKAKELFENGICLPSGTGLTKTQIKRICDIVSKKNTLGLAKSPFF